jgi:hypothetical protein
MRYSHFEPACNHALYEVVADTAVDNSIVVKLKMETITHSMSKIQAEGKPPTTRQVVVKIEAVPPDPHGVVVERTNIPSLLLYTHDIYIT